MPKTRQKNPIYRIQMHMIEIHLTSIINVLSSLHLNNKLTNFTKKRQQNATCTLNIFGPQSISVGHSKTTQWI